MFTAPLFAALLLAATGCGSLHIGGETHTHIERREVIETDDATVSLLVHWVNRFREMSQPVEEPLKGFEWDDQILTKHEKAKAEEDE